MNKVIGEMKTVMTNIEKGKVLQHLKLFHVLGGDESARNRHLSKGKLLPRERLNKLLDDEYTRSISTLLFIFLVLRSLNSHD